MTNNELTALAVSLLARHDLATLIIEAENEAIDDEEPTAIAAGMIIEGADDLPDLSDEDRFDLEEIICEMIDNPESAND